MLIIPVLGCFIVSAYHEEMDAMFKEISERVIHMHPEMSENSLRRIVYVVMSISIILFIFLWPIIGIWSLIKRK